MYRWNYASDQNEERNLLNFLAFYESLQKFNWFTANLFIFSIHTQNSVHLPHSQFFEKKIVESAGCTIVPSASAAKRHNMHKVICM